MGVAVFFAYDALHKLIHSNAISTVVCIALGGVVYIVCLFLFKGLSEEELINFPKGATLVRIFKNCIYCDKQNYPGIKTKNSVNTVWGDIMTKTNRIRASFILGAAILAGASCLWNASLETAPEKNEKKKQTKTGRDEGDLWQ